MKKTPIFEEIFMRLLRQPRILTSVVIGSVLSFIPIANLFAFGYLYRFAATIRRSSTISLPEWADWQGLFFDGLRFALIWLPFWFLPVALGWLVATGFKQLGLSAIAYPLLSMVFAVASLLFCAALYRFQSRGDFTDLRDVALIWRMATVDWKSCIIPALVALGIIAFAKPLYGLVFFTGFLILIAFTSLSYQAIEQRFYKSR